MAEQDVYKGKLPDNRVKDIMSLNNYETIDSAQVKILKVLTETKLPIDICKSILKDVEENIDRYSFLDVEFVKKE